MSHHTAWGLPPYPGNLRRGTFEFLLSLLACFFLLQCGSQLPSERNTSEVWIDRADDMIFVRTEGRIYPGRYNANPNRAQGHHAIVWKGGTAAEKALVESSGEDGQVLEALIAVGAVAGNNLPNETWLERDNPKSPAPDFTVKGTPVEILVSWEGLKEPLPLRDLLEWSGLANYEPRVGGHADQRAYWNSGCVYCLFSCPGGRISNAGATIRQQARGEVEWKAREALLPAEGTPVQLFFRVLEEEPVLRTAVRSDSGGSFCLWLATVDAVKSKGWRKVAVSPPFFQVFM